MLSATTMLAHGFVLPSVPLVEMRSRQIGAAAMAQALDPDDSAACVRLKPSEVPDCVDPKAGDWYACSEPPVEDAALQCFQLEDTGGSSKLNDKQSWICIDRASGGGDKQGDDSY